MGNGFESDSWILFSCSCENLWRNESRDLIFFLLLLNSAAGKSWYFTVLRPISWIYVTGHC
jgi:hypothetical protein